MNFADKTELMKQAIFFIECQVAFFDGANNGGTYRCVNEEGARHFYPKFMEFIDETIKEVGERIKGTEYEKT